MDKEFEWGDLRFLIAVERFGGLNQAAQHLGTSHQTVSRRLRSLERRLETRLIDDSNRRWGLTQKGREILKLAQQMEGIADEVLRLSRLESEDFAGRVSVASVAWGLDLIVAPALQEIAKTYPRITFDLISDDGLQSIEAGEADIALRFTSTPPQDLIGKEIGPVRLGVYGQPSQIEALRQGRFGDVPVIRLLSGGPHLNPWSDRSDRPEAPQRIITVNDLQSLLIAARNGLGVAVLPRAVASGVSALDCFEEVAIETPNSAWIIRHQDSRRSPSIRAVEAEIIRTARRVLGKEDKA